MSRFRLDLVKPEEDFDVAVGAFLNFCRAKNLSRETVSFYRKRLKPFVKFAQVRNETPTTFSRATVMEFVREKLRAVTPQTVNGFLRAISAFCSFLVTEGYRADNPVKGIPRVKEPQHYPRTLNDEQLAALLKQLNPKTFIGLRDLALILLMCDAGLRVSEVCGLTISDVDLARGAEGMFG